MGSRGGFIDSIHEEGLHCVSAGDVLQLRRKTNTLFND